MVELLVKFEKSMGFGLALVLFAELFLFIWIDHKQWRTWYTPFNFLAIPYALVLLVTLLSAGHFGLVDFYYPSLLPWIVGLPLFLLPSVVLRRCLPKKAVSAERTDPSPSLLPKLASVISFICFFFLLVKLFLLIRDSDAVFGSEAFGFYFAGKSWSGHLAVLGMAIIVLLVPFLELPWKQYGREKVWGVIIWLVLGGWMFFLFVNQIKAWIILPVLAGCIVRGFQGRLKLRIGWVVGGFAGCVAVFFLSYLLIYYSGNTLFPEETTLIGQIRAIAGLFLHYVTSGTMGLSIDMQQGILEQPDLNYILTPFYNIWYACTGQPLVSGYNPEFVYSGINYTNVRTMFGTLYVFTNPFVFALLVLLGSVICYAIFLLAGKRWLWAKALYAWVCTVLFMAWFDTYTQLLTTYELPVYLVLLCLLVSLAERYKFAAMKVL